MKGDHDKDPTSQASPREARGSDAPAVGTARQQGLGGSQEGGGSSPVDGYPGGPSTRQPLSNPQAAWDHLRGRYPERVWPEDLNRLEEQINLAFQQARPAEAWQLTHELLRAARTLSVEAAKARFRVNFGTEVCERCEGLRAGDNVTATCFQVQLCHYANVKKKPSPRQRGIIEGLGSPPAPKKM